MPDKVVSARHISNLDFQLGTVFQVQPSHVCIQYGVSSVHVCHLGNTMQVLDPLARTGKGTKPFKKTLRSDLSGGPLV